MTTELVSVIKDLVSEFQQAVDVAGDDDPESLETTSVVVNIPATALQLAKDAVAASSGIEDDEDNRSGGSLWETLADESVQISALIKCLSSSMMSGVRGSALRAAALFTTLLAVPGCPASFMSQLSVTGVLKAVREAAVKGRRRRAGGQQQQQQASKNAGRRKQRGGGGGGGAADQDEAGDDDAVASANAEGMDVDPGAEEEDEGEGGEAAADPGGPAALATCLQCLRGLAGGLAAVSLRGSNRDLLRDTSEAAATLLAAAGPEDGPLAEALAGVLRSLLLPLHGHRSETSSDVLRVLVPVASRREGTKTTGFAEAVKLAKDLARDVPDAGEAVAALTANMLLRSPDRAEARSSVATAAAQLIPLLAPRHRTQLLVLLARLGGSGKVPHRLAAVELAQQLLQAVGDDLFSAAAGWADPAPVLTPEQLERGEEQEGSNAANTADAGDAVPRMGSVSWGAVCISVLVRRSTDKVASVRAKAVGGLAASLQAWAQRGGDSGLLQGLLLPVLAQARCLAVQTVTAAVPSSAAAPAVAAGEAGARCGSGGGEEEEEPEGGPSTDASGQSPGGAGDASTRSAASGGSPSGEQQQQQQRQFDAPCRFRLVLLDPRQQDGGGGSHQQLLQGLLDTALERCRDEKGVVRKAAVQLLGALLLLRHASQEAAGAGGDGAGDDGAEAGAAAASLRTEEMAPLETASADPLVSVRRAALNAACLLMEALPHHAGVASGWVAVVLPLVHDNESALRDATLSHFAEMVAAKAAAAAATGRDGGPTAAAEAAARQLLPLLAALAGGQMHVQVGVTAACTALAGRRQLKAKPMAQGLQRIITEGGAWAGVSPHTAASSSSSEATGSVPRLAVSGAWLLLSAVAQQESSAVGWDFLMGQWLALLHIIAAAGEQCPREQAMRLSCDVATAALPLELPAPLLAAHIGALHQLEAAVGVEGSGGGSGGGGGGRDDNGGGGDGGGASSSSGAAAARAWRSQLLEASERVLSAYVEGVTKGGGGGGAGGNGPLPATERVASALFAVGEVVIACGAKPGAQLVVLVQALLSPGQTLGTAASYASAHHDNHASQQQQSGADGDEGGGQEQGGGQLSQQVVPAPVQAQAWAALGKLCVVDGALAKRCAPVFLQELTRSRLPAVRANVLVALRDLCVHFTALVDGQVPRLVAATLDGHPLVRRQGLALLANLLQKDYVKWRGLLLHRFILALVDDAPAVRRLAEYLLEDALATKSFMLSYNHLIEAMFSLNNCSDRLAAVLDSLASQGGAGGCSQAGAAGGAGPGGDVSLSQLLLATDADDRLGLRGATESAREKRLTIYKELLQRMSPEHKFTCAAKLCVEVLGGVVDETLPLGPCGELLHDALSVLACKEVRVAVPSGASAAADADADEAAGGGAMQAEAAAVAGARAAAAKGRLMGSMMRKHLLEQVVPVLVELKRLLAGQRHPLLGCLMAATAAMLREHRTELEDILVADRQMARELLYDMEQADRQEKAAAQQAAQQAAQAQAAALAHTEQQQAAGGSSRRRALPPGATPGTPMAAEVLAAAAAAAQQQQLLLQAPGGSAARAAGLGGAGITPRGAAAAQRAAFSTPGPSAPPSAGGGCGASAGRGAAEARTPATGSAAGGAPSGGALQGLATGSTAPGSGAAPSSAAPSSGGSGLSVPRLLHRRGGGRSGGGHHQQQQRVGPSRLKAASRAADDGTDCGGNNPPSGGPSGGGRAAGEGRRVEVQGQQQEEQERRLGQSMEVDGEEGKENEEPLTGGVHIVLPAPTGPGSNAKTWRLPPALCGSDGEEEEQEEGGGGSGGGKQVGAGRQAAAAGRSGGRAVAGAAAARRGVAVKEEDKGAATGADGGGAVRQGRAGGRSRGGSTAAQVKTEPAAASSPAVGGVQPKARGGRRTSTAAAAAAANKAAPVSPPPSRARPQRKRRAA